MKSVTKGLKDDLSPLRPPTFVATFISVADYLFHHINLPVQFEPRSYFSCFSTVHVLPSCDHGGGLRSLGEEGLFSRNFVNETESSRAPSWLRTISQHIAVFLNRSVIRVLYYSQWRTEGVVWGSTPTPKFRKYRWSPRSHKQEEPASRFPFVVHCVLMWL